jgi:hypothetical protein
MKLMRSLELSKDAFLSRSFDVVDFEDGSVIIESLEHRNFVGTWNESCTKLTIKPMTVSYDAFVADKILPWGKIRSFELPAMAAIGIEIAFEDIEFAQTEPDAERNAFIMM